MKFGFSPLTGKADRRQAKRRQTTRVWKVFYRKSINAKNSIIQIVEGGFWNKAHLSESASPPPATGAGACCRHFPLLRGKCYAAFFFFTGTGLSSSLRKRPVWLAGTLAISSGVPVA